MRLPARVTVRARVHLEIADRQRRRRHDRRPPRQRAARQKLGEGERLHEIVVAAGIEACHAIVDPPMV